MDHGKKAVREGVGVSQSCTITSRSFPITNSHYYCFFPPINRHFLQQDLLDKRRIIPWEQQKRPLVTDCNIHSTHAQNRISVRATPAFGDNVVLGPRRRDAKRVLLSHVFLDHVDRRGIVKAKETLVLLAFEKVVLVLEVEEGHHVFLLEQHKPVALQSLQGDTHTKNMLNPLHSATKLGTDTQARVCETITRTTLTNIEALNTSTVYTIGY